MFSKIITLAAILMLSVNITLAEGDHHKKSTQSESVKSQTTCPVMGGAVDKSNYVDVEGKRIYVCCGGCIAKIKADPKKYISQLESQGITVEDAPKK